MVNVIPVYIIRIEGCGLRKRGPCCNSDRCTGAKQLLQVHRFCEGTQCLVHIRFSSDVWQVPRRTKMYQAQTFKIKYLW